MFSVFLLLMSLNFVHTNESLIKIEHASFTIADLQGTIPQHLATLKRNPSLVSTYVHRMQVYRLGQISSFSKLLVSSPEYHLQLTKLPLKKIEKSWITTASAGNYQVIEHRSDRTASQLYVFLGYAEGKDCRADSIVNEFRERLERFDA
jgi:hypothetical protein